MPDTSDFVTRARAEIQIMLADPDCKYSPDELNNALAELDKIEALFASISSSATRPTELVRPESVANTVSIVQCALKHLNKKERQEVLRQVMQSEGEANCA